MSAYQYINNILPTIDEITNSDSRALHNTPLPAYCRPEEDISDLLEDKGKKLYMKLIGTLQWIMSIGRTVICYSVNAMSRFNRCPRVDQLKYVTGIFYYLRKYPNKSIEICSKYMNIEKLSAEKKTRKGEWNGYYSFIEEIDEKHPQPSDDPVETTIFGDSNSAGDTDNRRSTSGIVAFINSTPYRGLALRSKTQSIVVLLLPNLVL